MSNSELTIDEIIVKTEEALVGAGLSNQTVWGGYYKAYRLLRRYFKERHCKYYDIGIINDFIKEYQRKYSEKELCRGICYQAVRAARVLANYVDNGTVYTPRLERGTRYGLNDYFEMLICEYLKQADYVKNTADDAEWIIRRFMFFLQQTDHCNLLAVDDSHARRFIIFMAESYSDGTLHNIMCYLRKFTEYAFKKHYLSVDISKIFTVPIKRQNRIYPCISDEDISRLLAQVNTNTVVGKRDFAMLQLGLTAGMRTIDIINLKLQDINWTRGEIHLIQRKTGQSVFLPLMPDAGRAIADYILNGRPTVNTDFIFLTVSPPIRKIHDETGMGWMFNKYLRMAGIEKKPFDGKSFHALRRRIATKMIISGTPVTTVSQILGQTRMDSTKQYLSFDTERLCKCAGNFDGIPVDGGVFE